MIWDQKRNRLPFILQAMDTGGKDGIIPGVFEGVNPKGIRGSSFGVSLESGIRARLSVADPPVHAGNGWDPDLPSKALRGHWGW